MDNVPLIPKKEMLNRRIFPDPFKTDEINALLKM